MPLPCLVKWSCDFGMSKWPSVTKLVILLCVLQCFPGAGETAAAVAVQAVRGWWTRVVSEGCHPALPSTQEWVCHPALHPGVSMSSCPALHPGVSAAISCCSVVSQTFIIENLLNFRIINQTNRTCWKIKQFVLFSSVIYCKPSIG